MKFTAVGGRRLGSALARLACKRKMADAHKRGIVKERREA